MSLYIYSPENAVFNTKACVYNPPYGDPMLLGKRDVNNDPINEVPWDEDISIFLELDISHIVLNDKLLKSELVLLCSQNSAVDYKIFQTDSFDVNSMTTSEAEQLITSSPNSLETINSSKNDGSYEEIRFDISSLLKNYIDTNKSKIHLRLTNNSASSITIADPVHNDGFLTIITDKKTDINHTVSLDENNKSIIDLESGKINHLVKNNMVHTIVTNDNDISNSNVVTNFHYSVEYKGIIHSIVITNCLNAKSIYRYITSTEAKDMYGFEDERTGYSFHLNIADMSFIIDDNPSDDILKVYNPDGTILELYSNNYNNVHNGETPFKLTKISQSSSFVNIDWTNPSEVICTNEKDFTQKIYFTGERIEKIEYPGSNQEIRFNYFSQSGNDYLSNIEEYLIDDLHDRLVGKYVLTYYTTDMSLKSVKHPDGITTVTYEYENDKVKKVISNNGLVSFEEFTYYPNDNYTKIKNQFNKEFSVYYNDSNQKVMTSFEDGYVTYESIMNFEGNYVKQRKEVVSSNENLISDVNLSTWAGYNTNECDASISNALFPDAIGTSIIKRKGIDNQERAITKTITLNDTYEGDELFFSIWGKTEFSLSSQFYIEISIDGSSRTHTFSFNKAESGWQILSGIIIAENNYNSVTFTIKNKGNIDVYLGKPTLYKKSKKIDYEYNNNSQIQGLSFGTNQLEFEYDKEKLVRAATPSGRIINYTYDTDGNIRTIEDECSLFKIENQYSNKNLVKQIKTTIDGKTSEVSYEYNEKNELIKSVDESGLPVNYVYDKFGRVVELQDSSGIVYNTVYDTKGNIIETKNHINDFVDGGTFKYGSKNEVQVLTTKNETEYDFSYDTMNLFDNVSINGAYLESRNYEKVLNNYNTGLMTEKQYGISTSNKFQFEYDKKFRLLKKKNNLTDMVTISYDDENKKVSISDQINQTSKVIDYDSEGRTTKETITDSNQDIVEHLYSYDNLGGLQKRSYKSNDSNYTDRSYDFDYAYEFQEYSLDRYFDRISTAYLNDFLRPNKAGNTVYSKIKIEQADGSYVFEDAPTLKLFDIDFDNELNQNVMRFNDTEGCLVFTNEKLNSNRVDGKYYGKHQFIRDDWDNSDFRVDKIIYSWIRVTGQVSSTREIMRLGSLSLNINNDKELYLDDNGTILLTELPIFFDEWTLVGLRINQSGATVFINGNYSNHSVSQTAWSINNLSIGNYPASNPSQTYLDAKSLVQADCIIDVLYVGYGTNNVTEENLNKMYKDGKFYLDTEPKYSKEQVSYYNHAIYSGSEVITLNGSYVSSFGKEPKSYSYTDGNHKLNKTKLFKYDHQLQKHTFGSFSNFRNYNTIKDSMLSYDFIFGIVGSINIFVRPSSDYTSAKRTILGFVNGVSKILDLFIDDNYELKYTINGTTYSSGLKLDIDEWNMVTMLWQSNQIQVSVNNSVLDSKSTVTVNLSGSTLYVGSSATSGTPEEHFEGQLQMLSVWSENITTQKITDIYNDGLQLTVQTEFDHNGRMKTKNIISSGNVLTKKYQYFDEKYTENNVGKQKFNPLPTSEIDIDGNEILYIYDEYFNVITKETIDDSGKPISVTHYEYDDFKRLAKEKLSSVSIDETDPVNPIRNEIFNYSYEYKYDSNGNILEKTGVDDNKQVLFKDTYHYSITYKDRLERISRLENSIETNIYNFTYSSEDQFRPITISKNGQSSSLSWNGPRLMQYGSTQYTYNEGGLRVKKTGTNLNVKYDLDGSMVIKSTDIINSKIIDYHFDQNEQVIGLRHNGKEFLYQRNILGEIYGIIDSSGKQFVKYEYTAFGVPSITLGNGLNASESLIAQTLGEQNIYLYKGYVYDSDTGLYYCQTRYYDPEIGRWISIDDISYLDSNSIDGLNLYTYCVNSPVMMSDPTGKTPKWLKIAGLVGLVVGVVLVVAAITVLTMGVGTTVMAGTLAGSILHGAAVGALWGAGIGLGVGATAGAIGSLISGESFGSREFWSDTAYSAMLGFGVGAVVGAIIGGTNGASHFRATQLMNSIDDSLLYEPGFDCSEIADDLLRMNNNKGKILNMSTKNGNINVMEFGKVSNYDYHSVFKLGRYMVDPRYGSVISKMKYMSMLKNINTFAIILI